MNAVQQWTAGVCLAVLAVSLLQHLMPEGAMRRMAELAAGIFLLCAVLVPAVRALSLIHISLFQSIKSIFGL